MGYERKRGKIADLNGLLRGDGDQRRFADGRRRHDDPSDRASTSSPSIPTPCWPAIRPGDLSVPWPTPQSTALRSRKPAGCRRLYHSPAAGGDQSVRCQPVVLCPACAAVIPASIRIPVPSPMSIRICSAKVRSSARVSMKSIPLKRSWPAVSPTTSFSATICSKAATPGPDCRATSSCTRNIRPATAPM